MTMPPLPPRFQMLSDLQSGTMEVCRADAVRAYGAACAAEARAACIAICDLEASKSLEAGDLEAYYGTSAYAISNAIKAMGTT